MNKRKFVEDVLVILCWSVIISSVILRTVYETPLLTSSALFILFVLSVIAGAILVDAVKVVLGCAASMLLSVLFSFLCLISPSFYLPYSLGQLVYTEAIIMIFRIMVPTVPIVCFLGAAIGGYIGEKWIA
ncbi:MAG: hypothetical protein QW279_13725 [Candidatus Jordarchaeaceae archaeon]